jgi:integrase
MLAEGKDVTKGPVFVNRKGGWLSQPTLYRRSFLPALARAGLPKVKPYATRHTSATLLLGAGVSIKVVSQRLGHENIETTLKHYVHAMPDQQEKAVEVVSNLFGGDWPTIVPQASILAVAR